MYLLIHAGIKVKPCKKKGLQMSHSLQIITLVQVLNKLDSFEINIVQGLLLIYTVQNSNTISRENNQGTFSPYNLLLYVISLCTIRIN